MCMQHLADGTDLFNLFAAEIADHRAAAALLDHHAVSFELNEGLTNQVPGRAKAVNEFILDQAFTRAQTAKENVLFE